MDRPDPATSTGGPGGRRIDPVRAFAVIVAAVVLGVLILQSGYHAPVVALPTVGTPTSSTTTTVPAETTTTVSNARVTVLVANDSTTNGVAGEYSTVLTQAGWTLLAPATASPPIRATSSVYYAANKQSDAEAVAAALGVPQTAVFPVSSATPVPSTRADVIVIIGSDLAAETPPSTVPHGTTTTVPKTKTTKATTTTKA